jgi:thiamine phosphate synthase YjbQ (UPF0047 family)
VQTWIAFSRGLCRTESVIQTAKVTTAPAHVRTALTTVNLSIPLHGGELALGVADLSVEHRRVPHSRALHCT